MFETRILTLSAIGTNSIPALASQSIHLWILPLRLPARLLEEFAATLDPNERATLTRISNFSAPSGNRYIAAHGWLRKLLECYTEIEADDIPYLYSPEGKPSLATGEVYFNASDSGNHALIGISVNLELGVDIEAWPRKIRYREAIIRRHYTHSEASAIAEHEQVLQRDYSFLEFWTRKEAYGKAIGLGIRYPMQQIDLSADILDAFNAVGEEHDWYVWTGSEQDKITSVVTGGKPESYHLFHVRLSHTH